MLLTQTLILLTTCNLASSLTWEPVPAVSHASGIIQGVAALSPTRAILAGGFNTIGNGLFTLDTSAPHPLNETMSVSVCKICMMTCVKFHSLVF